MPSFFPSQAKLEINKSSITKYKLRISKTTPTNKQIFQLNINLFSFFANIPIRHVFLMIINNIINSSIQMVNAIQFFFNSTKDMPWTTKN
jgi:hypothetical protein